MEGLSVLLVVIIVLIIFIKIKHNHVDVRAGKCDICGKDYDETIGLKDGRMCYNCAKAKYSYRRIDLANIIKNSRYKTLTVNEMKNYINEIQERGELMKSFTPTRTSEDGQIEMDDNLGLFLVKSHPDSYPFAHRPQDVKGFKIVIDKDYTNPSDNVLIEGGHILIKLDEPIDEISIAYGSKRDFFGAKHEVRKALEPDLKFLEEITGLRRG